MAVLLIQSLAALALLLMYIAFFRKKRRHPNYPPGPPALPLLGNIIDLANSPSIQLSKWKKKYGNIYSIKLGLDDAIVINDPKLIKELFANLESSGRPSNPVFLAISEGRYGIINTEGQHWERQRRFVLRNLRDMGFAKTSMEGMILQEAEFMIEWFVERKDKPILGTKIFNAAVVNSLWNIVSGERDAWNESIEKNKSGIVPKAAAFFDAVQNAAKTGLLFAPFLRFIAPKLVGWTDIIDSTKNLNEYSNNSIARHRATLDENNPRDLIDHTLIEMGKTTNPKSSFYKDRGEKNLRASILELFSAGSETTSITLSWTLLYLSHHPVTQHKLINEIHRVIGRCRLPSLSDKPRLPFTVAVIQEVLRYSSLVPLGVLHKMINSMMFHGYYLPKNTIIISNLYSSLHDPDIWGDPDKFRPDRFLSDDGTRVIHKDALIPFSTGKRKCLGESLALETLFLFTTCIFQRFEVLPDPEKLKPDFIPEPGFVNSPKPFRVVMKEHE